VDSICLVFPDRVFTGDTLCLDDGGAGRDDLPGGDPAAYWESLTRLATLPDGLLVQPARDYRGRAPSILGRQKKTKPFMQIASPVEYAEYRKNLGLGTADWMKDVLKANYACARDPRAAWIRAGAPSSEMGGSPATGVSETRGSSIPPRVLRQKMSSANPPVLVDVREKEELSCDLGHIEGILDIPVGALAFRLAELEPHAGREIVTVCRSGAGAGTARLHYGVNCSSRSSKNERISSRRASDSSNAL
jgi:rhodanese-related sulfurtransferase